MLLNIIDSPSFNQARQTVLNDIESHGGIHDKYSISNLSDSTLTIARAIHFIKEDQSRPIPTLKTAEEKKLLFKQLTQMTVLPMPQQQKIIDIWLDCARRNTIKPNQPNDEFEALSSINVFFHIPQVPENLPQSELCQLNLAQMYSALPCPE